MPPGKKNILVPRSLGLPLDPALRLQPLSGCREIRVCGRKRDDRLGIREGVYRHKELDLTNKYGLQVIAIKEVISDRITFIPKADFVIKDSDILVIIGEEKRLSKLNPL
jgi:hypothetical protein